MQKDKLKVAIQGVRASFHDVAARRFFAENQVEAIECSSFALLCESLKNGRCDRAIMAIENTIAGSILPNYSLLQSYGFKILGETYLRIELCLMALPGTQLEEVQFVQSHPMALLQCQKFLATVPAVKSVEASDTAESALEIKSKNLRNYAAIASQLAAETYGLSLLKTNIETDAKNFTRFLILCRAEDYQVPAHVDKSSLRFEVRHEPGSLARVLELFHHHQVNLTKIQSTPILGKPYQYGFHVDVEWKDGNQYRAAMSAVANRTENLLSFGEYTSGEKAGA